MDQDTVALAEHLDWTHARARPAENVLREDRLLLPRDRPRLSRRRSADVDARRAADDAGCRRVRPTALEAAVRPMRASGAASGGRSSRARSSAKLPMSEVCAGGSLGATGVSPDTIAGNPRVFRNRLRRCAGGGGGPAVRPVGLTRMKAPHALAAEHVVEEFDGDLKRDLSAAEASARLARSGRIDYLGPGGLRSRRSPYDSSQTRWWGLIGAVLVSLLIGERVEAAVIAAIASSTGFSASYKRRAQRARCSHFARFSSSARERRSGRTRAREVGVERAVPGDLVVLREGERVPADARVVDAAGLAMDESTLTGESVPVAKAVDAVRRGCSPSARRWPTRARLSRARGQGIVTATGSATELGEIAGLTQRRSNRRRRCSAASVRSRE